MPEDPQYIPRKTVNESYRPKSYLMSPGLQRAREPYRIRNAITGLTMAAFGVGVWAYSISAVKQDVFDDVDEEAKALAGSGLLSLEDEERASKEGRTQATAAGLPISPPHKVAADASQTSVGRGVLAGLLDRTFPRLLDPARKTLVWGAPSIDNIGRMSDRIDLTCRK